MIVQALTVDADQTAPRFIIPQLEHSRLAGQFAAAWGNQRFASLEPRALMEQLVDAHDRGWDETDAEIGRDPATGLPWNLVSTPLPAMVRSSRRGPELNEVEHPLIGLLSSMHSWGLYHGRYGLSDKVFVDRIPAEHRAEVDVMLADERARQARLRDQLAADPTTAPWVDEAALFDNYRLLQFFDTLALYFNCTPDAERRTASFGNVPVQRGEQVVVEVARVAPGTYRVSPYPFARAPLVVTCAGRWLAPQPEGSSMPEALRAAPGDVETITLVPPSADRGIA